MKKFLTLSAVLLSTATLTAYADIQTDTIDEVWGKPTLVYGGGLSDAQVEQVDALLNVKIENVNRQVVTGDKVDQYLGTYGVQTSTLYSSVLVQKQGSNGVQVDIKTPKNITKITETQYANAAITAGASNVKIDVVAPIQVTGESALTGVYVALEANGQEIDSARTEAAQQELETVNEIANAQANNDEFDTAAFDIAISELKQELAKHDGQASSQVIRDIISDVMKKNGLSNVLTDEQIDNLVSFAQTYQKTDAISSDEVAKQLSQFKDDAAKYISDNFKVDSSMWSNMWNSISSFFENLWKSITGWFI